MVGDYKEFPMVSLTMNITFRSCSRHGDQATGSNVKESSYVSTRLHRLAVGIEAMVHAMSGVCSLVTVVEDISKESSKYN